MKERFYIAAIKQVAVGQHEEVLLTEPQCGPEDHPSVETVVVNGEHVVLRVDLDSLPEGTHTIEFGYCR